MPLWWPGRLSGASSFAVMLFFRVCFALEQKGKADLTVTESYLVAIGYKL